MTRLGKASALIAVFAAGYAILMLINGQPTDFKVSAGICAAALLGATLPGVPGLVQPRRRQVPVRPDLAEDLIVNETMGALLPSGWSVRRASTPKMAVNPPELISRVAIDCSSRPAARGIET
jgi:hypothetical protein